MRFLSFLYGGGRSRHKVSKAAAAAAAAATSRSLGGKTLLPFRARGPSKPYFKSQITLKNHAKVFWRAAPHKKLK